MHMDDFSSVSTIHADKTRIPPPRAVGWASTAIAQWQRSQLTAAGGNPSEVPDEPFHFLRLPEVERRSGLTRSTIYRHIDAGTFPAPVVLGNGLPAQAA
jgi:predicted DNA-binding transcriptional regulator AlpA